MLLKKPVLFIPILIVVLGCIGSQSITFKDFMSHINPPVAVSTPMSAGSPLHELFPGVQFDTTVVSADGVDVQISFVTVDPSKLIAGIGIASPQIFEPTVGKASYSGLILTNSRVQIS